MPDTKPSKTTPDWEKIENDYRAGVLSQREIAAAHGVSHTAVQKRARRCGWERDLSGKIRAKADALVAKSEVAAKVAKASADGNSATDREVVEANAEAIAQVRLTHRRDIRRARTLAMRLLDELEAMGDTAPALRDLAELLAVETANGGGSSADVKEAAKRMELLDAVIALPTRTQTMKMLADTMTKLIGLEREAYSLANAKDSDEPGSGLSDLKRLLGEIDGAGTGLPRHADPAAV